MKNKDDILLKQFFDQHKQQIADNGFSEKVMQRIPQQHTERAAFRQLSFHTENPFYFSRGYYTPHRQKGKAANFTRIQNRPSPHLCGKAGFSL